MSQQSSRGDGPSGTHRLILRVYRSDGQADAFYLAHGLTIGRSVANTVVLPDDDGADRTHARVAFLDDGTATLYSVGPDNEILVDGSAVHQLPLSTGVRFRIGRHQFECLSGQRPAEEISESAMSCPYCNAWDLPQATTRCPQCGQDVLVLNLEGIGLFRLVVPAQFGDFRAQHLVARGGMGVVLKGVHQAESYPVAVKILLPHRNLDAQAGERFLQEASLMAQVQSPEIIRLIHTGHVGRLNYLVMEWVDRGTLRDVLLEHRSQNSLPVFEDVLAWLVDTCRGLAAIHALGIIHRDVKPSNILLADNGHAKLADMGIAKQMADSSHGLTTTGMVPGTTEYMPPEAINPPWLVDQRGDQYSVGVTFYELLTGQRPVGAWPAASSVNRTVPKEFDAFLAKLLSPSPQGRFHDMTAVLHAEDGLMRFLTPRWTYRRRNGIWINYFEAINLSCFPLKDFVADVLVHRKDGSTGSFRMRADFLLAGGRLRKTLIFDQEVTADLAFVEAKATCSRGNIELDPAATRDEEVAKWDAFPMLGNVVPPAVMEHRLLCGKASVLAFSSSLLIPALWLVSFGVVYAMAGGATGKVLASILCVGVLFALFTRRCRLAYLRGISPILRKAPQLDQWLSQEGERLAKIQFAPRPETTKATSTPTTTQCGSTSNRVPNPKARDTEPKQPDSQKGKAWKTLLPRWIGIAFWIAILRAFGLDSYHKTLKPPDSSLNHRYIGAPPSYNSPVGLQGLRTRGLQPLNSPLDNSYPGTGLAPGGAAIDSNRRAIATEKYWMNGVCRLQTLVATNVDREATVKESLDHMLMQIDEVQKVSTAEADVELVQMAQRHSREWQQYFATVADHLPAEILGKPVTSLSPQEDEKPHGQQKAIPEGTANPLPAQIDRQWEACTKQEGEVRDMQKRLLLRYPGRSFPFPRTVQHPTDG
jgi:hypothetical protein